MTVSRALALPLILLVKAYQLLISPLTGASCRFYPSCSAYALTALERFGLVRGTWLTVRRLLRCHPWNPGGVDHVPERVPKTRERVRGIVRGIQKTQEQDAPSVRAVVTGHRHPVTDR
jgi:putative membrane protein insertion efficiency factor